MKVLHLISGGDVGGAKTHVITLLSELQKNIQVELVCLSGGPFIEDAIKAGIPSFLLEQKSRFDVRVIKALKEKLLRDGVDVLHCHGARANFIAARLKKHIHIPVITTIHSDFRHDFDHSFYKKLFFTWMNRFSLKQVDYFLNVSKVMKEVMVEEGFNSKNMYTIYNGLDTDCHVKSYDNIDYSHVIFGCATRLVPIKGTDVLLKAVKRLVDKGYKPSVKIAGHGETKYMNLLEDYMKDNHLEPFVEFLGFVDDMDTFYAGIDINLLPSYTEGFPYALLESGARGIATLSSSAGGIVEMIEEGVSGKMFTPGKDEELANIMAAILDGEIDVPKLGRNFRERVVDKFSAQAMAESHIRIYDEISNK